MSINTLYSQSSYRVTANRHGTLGKAMYCGTVVHGFESGKNKKNKGKRSTSINTLYSYPPTLYSYPPTQLEIVARLTIAMYCGPVDYCMASDRVPAKSIIIIFF